MITKRDVNTLTSINTSNEKNILVTHFNSLNIEKLTLLAKLTTKNITTIVDSMTEVKEKEVLQYLERALLGARAESELDSTAKQAQRLVIALARRKSLAVSHALKARLDQKIREEQPFKSAYPKTATVLNLFIAIITLNLFKLVPAVIRDIFALKKKSFLQRPFISNNEIQRLSQIQVFKALAVEISEINSFIQIIQNSIGPETREYTHTLGLLKEFMKKYSMIDDDLKERSQELSLSISPIQYDIAHINVKEDFTTLIVDITKAIESQYEQEFQVTVTKGDLAGIEYVTKLVASDACDDTYDDLQTNHLLIDNLLAQIGCLTSIMNQYSRGYNNHNFCHDNEKLLKKLETLAKDYKNEQKEIQPSLFELKSHFKHQDDQQPHGRSQIQYNSLHDVSLFATSTPQDLDEPEQFSSTHGHDLTFTANSESPQKHGYSNIYSDDEDHTKADGTKSDDPYADIYDNDTDDDHDTSFDLN